MPTRRSPIPLAAWLLVGCAGAPAPVEDPIDPTSLLGTWVVCQEVWAVDGWMELQGGGAFRSERSIHHREIREAGSFSVRGDTMVFHTAAPEEGIAVRESRRYGIARRNGRLMLLSLRALDSFPWWVQGDREERVSCGTPER